MTDNVVPLFTLPTGERAPDPHEAHRAEIAAMLEGLLAEVRAGRIDGVMLALHQSPTHPDGAAWGVAFGGNVDLIARLGALEFIKADMIHRAGL